MKSKYLEEAYQHCKNYLNSSSVEGSSIALLHKMCASCERWNGIKEHDYSECRDTACFKLFLCAKYAEWCESFSSGGYMDGR